MAALRRSAFRHTHESVPPRQSSRLSTSQARCRASAYYFDQARHQPIERRRELHELSWLLSNYVIEKTVLSCVLKTDCKSEPSPRLDISLALRQNRRFLSSTGEL